MPLSRFNKLVHDGLSELKKRLPDRWVGRRDADLIAEEIDGLSFPASLAFLGAREPPQDGSHRRLIERAARSVAGEESMRRAGVEAHVVEDAVNSLLRNGEPPDRALGKLAREPGLRERIFDQTVAALAEEAGVPALSLEQAHEVALILKSGEFYEDFGSATAAIGALLQPATQELPRDVAAVAREKPASALDMWNDLMEDGKLDKTRLKPRLQEFYEKENSQSVAELTRSLIGPENRTVRAAVIIYAKAHGISLKEGDLDLLHDTVFGEKSPDLGNLLVEAYDRFVSALGNYAFRDALKRMGVRRL